MCKSIQNNAIVNEMSNRNNQDSEGISDLIGVVEKAADTISQEELAVRQATTAQGEVRPSTGLPAPHQHPPHAALYASAVASAQHQHIERGSRHKRRRHSAESSDDSSYSDHSHESKEKHVSIGARAKKRQRSRKSVAHDVLTTDRGHQRSTVQHHYHDYASGLADDQDTASQEQYMNQKNRGSIGAFPAILQQILDRATEGGYSHIVSWQSHGRAFHVHDQETFVSEIMPRYFRQTRFSSFQRQLSLYGFLRLTRKGPDHNAYYHELCLRGMPHLCTLIQRQRVKGYWVRQSSSPETEPHFETMPMVGVPDPTPIAESSLPRPSPPPGMLEPEPTRYEGQYHDIALPSPNSHYGHGPHPTLPSHTGSTVANLAYRPETGGSMKIAPASEERCSPSSLVKQEHALKILKMALISDTVDAVMDLTLVEQEELAAFLSDVDLDSDEDDYAYKNEGELGKIHEANQYNAGPWASV